MMRKKNPGEGIGSDHWVISVCENVVTGPGLIIGDMKMAFDACFIPPAASLFSREE